MLPRARALDILPAVAMNRFTLHPPEVAARTVTFRWSVEPASSLYRASRFTLRFPPDLPLSRVPEKLWWVLALACLHSHWSLLRPCRVFIPIKLGPGEAEFWSRLLDSEIATLETSGGSQRFGREIEIVDGTSSVEPLAAIPDAQRCATAFSGGKDSLVHVGILSELTRAPILVTTTSPLPPLEDHLTPRRQHVLSEIARRRDVTLIEVHSDFRAVWDNGFSRQLGYPVAVNEITDTFLYFGVLLVAGVALGATHLFLASEAEVQENAEIDGRVVQHHHFMYSAITQRALQALLRGAAIRYGSLTCALHSAQVQQLLWTRYADLRDLQYSCWSVRGNDAACSRCRQCLRLALTALAHGDTPEEMGVDLVSLFNAMGRWTPQASDATTTALPTQVVRRNLEMQTIRSLAATPLGRAVSALGGRRPLRLVTPRGLAAVLSYAQLRRRALRWPPGPSPGYRPGFLRLVDPLLREPVASLLAQHFPPAEDAAYAGILSRADRLAAWITEPLGGEP
jgi:hypothetical protein